MQRRAFVSSAVQGLLGVPLVARARPRAALARVGILSPNSRESPTSRAAYDELRGAMRDLGYQEGRNIVFEARWAEGRTERLPELALELGASHLDALVTFTTQATLAAKLATERIPIVMVNVTDPIGAGLIASLAHPGGTVTGLVDFGLELVRKSVELVHELIPAAARIAVLVSDNPVHPFQLRQIEAAGKQLDMTILPVPAMNVGELDGAIDLARRGAAALLVLGGGLQSGNRELIAALALKARLPAVAYVRPYVDAGVLASYGHKVLAQYRSAATYLDKILRGARPGDLPVEQPTSFELVLNLRTAEALGIAVPRTVLLRAEELVR